MSGRGRWMLPTRAQDPVPVIADPMLRVPCSVHRAEPGQRCYGDGLPVAACPHRMLHATGPGLRTVNEQ